MTDYKKILIEDEGLRLKPYKCSEGKLTIGVGRNLDANGISEDEAMYMLEHDINKAKRAAKGLVERFDALSDDIKIVLVSMVFQMGAYGVSKFQNMLQAIEIGAYDVAAVEMLESRWARQTPNRAKRLAERMKNG